MKKYTVYILKYYDSSYYIGITGNFKKRMIQHTQGHFISCYTFRKRPVSLKYTLEFNDVIQAILFEKKIKGWSRAKKQALINNAFETIQILAECRNFSYSKYKPDPYT